MAYTYAELRALSEAELIRTYDIVAVQTQTSLAYYRDELQRRDQDAATRAMLESARETVRLTRSLETLTVSLKRMTLASVVIGIVAIVLAVVALARG